MRAVKKFLLAVVDFVDHYFSRCPKSALFIAAGLLGGIVLTVMIQAMFAGQKTPIKVAAKAPTAAAVEEAQKAPARVAMPEPYRSPYGNPAEYQPNPNAVPTQYIIQPGTAGDTTRRAVDYEGQPPHAQPAPQVIMPRVIRYESAPVVLQHQEPQYNEQGQYVEMPVGRNGLLQNPCVDPSSSRGAAYSRAYQ